MHRRDFLKLGSLLSLALVAPINPLSKLSGFAVETEAQGLLYRGTHDGEVYVSKDAGGTWQLHTRFGADCAITRLSVGAGQRVVARIEYLGHPFYLSLGPDTRAWRTM